MGENNASNRQIELLCCLHNLFRVRAANSGINQGEAIVFTNQVAVDEFQKGQLNEIVAVFSNVHGNLFLQTIVKKLRIMSERSDIINEKKSSSSSSWQCATQVELPVAQKSRQNKHREAVVFSPPY